MKQGKMNALLPAALADAELVFCYGSKLGWDPADVLRPLGAKARTFDELPRLVADIVAAAQPGDHVLIMSNGGFGGIHGTILEALAQRNAIAPATA
jgi:UDP-N-acetylmuramate: L-alanyl-gamma-D-glutamyl-meso-diaminopimelate ligase